MRELLLIGFHKPCCNRGMDGEGIRGLGEEKRILMVRQFFLTILWVCTGETHQAPFLYRIKKNTAHQMGGYINKGIVSMHLL